MSTTAADSAAGIHVAAVQFESERRILQAFTGGDKHHPHSASVTFNADVLEPLGSFVRDDLVGIITYSQSLQTCR
jgi:hypothetical protein